MTKDERIANFKYSVLQHARENKSVTSTCKLFNITRTTYYVWLRRFSQLGYLGLLGRQRSKPSMPNKIRPDIELIIYNYIRDYPTYGPRRISNELKAQGIIMWVPSKGWVESIKRSVSMPTVVSPLPGPI